MAKFGIVTGSSTGIGYELAKLAAADGYTLLLAADTPFADVPPGAETLDVDLSTFDGVDRMLAAVNGRQIDLLCANAGHGLGRAFLDQDPEDWRHVIDTNVTGTTYLIQKVLRDMVARNDGKLLVTGSIAGYVPGSFQAVYNGTKAYVDSLVAALQNEIKDVDGVTLTNLLPGPTDTEFFARGDMMDTDVGTDPNKEDPADTARNGWNALMSGKASVVSGFANKVQVALSGITPEAMKAEQHRKMAEPGTADT